MKPENKKKAVYTPESPMQHPGHLLKTMGRAILDSRELAWALFVRDISAQYRQSFMGIFWAFLPPIVTSLIFIILQQKGVVNLGKTDVPYPLFVLVGTILWQLFNESINAPLKAAISAKPILAKTSIPYEALILSSFYQMIFSLLIKLIVIIGALLLFSHHLSVGILFSLPVIVLLILLGITLGLFLTPLGMLYNDIQFGLTVVLQLLFFVTPVVYPTPRSFPYSLIAVVNPVSPFLSAGRDLITMATTGNLGIIMAYSFIMAILLVFAWIIFRVSMPIIIERMSA